MTYGPLHRYFLRSVASRGVLTVGEAERIMNSFDDDTSRTSIRNLINEINIEIRPFQQTIKLTNDELTNEEVVVFVSLGNDEATKSQNVFNANELEYFRLLMEEIMSIESRQITGILAVNIASKIKGPFAKTEAEKLLNKWCCMHYLDKDNDNYVLGVRTIHEFESYLRQTMPDETEECCLCKQIVFRGYDCPACALAVHTRCLNKYLETIDKWPCCKAQFSMSQLERLNCESSRLMQTQHQQSEEYSMAVNESPEEVVTQDIEYTQDVIPEISQRMTRKRKRN